MKSLKYTDGDWVLNELVHGPDVISQNVKHLIQTRASEWFLNLDHGFNYTTLEGQKLNEDEVASAIRDCLEQEPEVEEIKNLDFSFNREQRKLNVKFEVITVSGDSVGGDMNVDSAGI